MTTPKELTTKQEVFDFVSNHLLTQGRKATRPDPKDPSGVGCAYRSEDGCKCAVGCIVPDEEYNPGMEGLKVFAIIEGNQTSISAPSPTLTRIAESVDGIFLSGLQRIHDWTDVVEWPKRLREFARDNRLDASKLPPMPATHDVIASQ